ncbi:MAG: helix-turn-helix domain-containing protein [Bryobacteraceae bacterium]
MVGIDVICLDDYVVDVLLRDLVGHDRRPVSFLVYVWLAGEQHRRGGAVRISYRELAENLGASKSSVQAGVSWLVRRKLISAEKDSATATPVYTVETPWRRTERKS